MTTKVMEGFRILEVAEHTFVPAAAAILADWGAEVIKVEHVERGDAMRGLGQTGTTGFQTKVPVLMEHANRGKKSIGLDLTDPDGLEIVYRLAATCDVFLTNKLPRVAEKLKIGVDEIRAANPRIVYVRGSGYGNRGPDADAGGYDFLGYWSRSGIAEALRKPDLPPPFPPGPAYGDSIGAMTIAGGICAALLHRERTNEAPLVDVSLLATGMWALSGAISIGQLTGGPWMGAGAAASSAATNPLVGMYRTADDRFMALSMLQGFVYWPDMCRRLELSHLLDDPRFSTVETLMANAAEAGQFVAEAFASRSQAEWIERLTGAPGQWSAVQDSFEVADDPQSVANGYLQDVELADGTPFRLVATPVQFDGGPARPTRAPEFNEHGDQILLDDLGLDWDRIIELKLKGAVT